MDWSQLETLEVEDPTLSFLEAVKHELPSLRSVKFSCTWGCSRGGVGNERFDDALELFLRSVGAGGLESVSLVNVPHSRRQVNAVVSKHARTLTELDVHSYESENYYWERPVLPSTQIERVGKHCPNLEHLSIDTSMEQLQSKAFVGRPRFFQRLRALDLYLNYAQHERNPNASSATASRDWSLAVRSVRDDDHTEIDTASAYSVFEKLGQRGAMDSLQELSMLVGDWGRGYYPMTLPAPGFLEYRHYAVVCRQGWGHESLGSENGTVGCVVRGRRPIPRDISRGLDVQDLPGEYAPLQKTVL